MNSMKKVLGYGTAGASFLYIIAGMFGFAAFASCNGDYPMNKNKNPPVRWTFDDIM
jgi:amino acid permease